MKLRETIRILIRVSSPTGELYCERGKCHIYAELYFQKAEQWLHIGLCFCAPTREANDQESFERDMYVCLHSFSSLLMLVYALQTDLLFRWRNMSTKLSRDKNLKLIAKVRF